MSPSSAAWSFVCREQFLLPHRPFSPLGMLSLGIHHLSRGRQCRYNSNEVIGLNWLLILWIYTTHGCLHSEEDFVLELSPQPKSGIAQKSVHIMSTVTFVSQMQTLKKKS